MSDVDAWIAAGIYDPDAPRADDRLEVLRFSAANGVPLDELIRRADDGTLSRAVVDRVLAIERELTLDEITGQVGLPPEVLVRVWLALGFPPPPEGQPTFNRDDLEMLRSFAAVHELFGMEAALQFTRVLGSSMARISEAAVTSFLLNVEGPLATTAAGDAERAKASATGAQLAASLPDLLRVLHRRHFVLAVERSRATQDHEDAGTFHLTVGFCDLVGYTAWSQTLPSRALAAAVDAFESTAHEVITRAGGRLVKSLGDAVLFVTPGLEAAAEIALDLTDFVAAHPVLTELRTGIATGDVLGRDGDFYGPVVNLAARLVKETTSGTVVSDQPVDGLANEALGPVELKGIGTTVARYVVRRPAGRG